MRIAGRFNGPPQSGHGGYSAGLIASALPEPDRGVRVRLRRPPPLDTELAVTTTADGVEVYAGDQLIAAAQPALPAGAPAGPLPVADAELASARYAGHAEHPFPTCFGCGPARSPGDGLRVFAGPAGEGRTAAVWTVPADVSPLLVWAALDCPGGWTVVTPGRPYVLGQLTAVLDAVPAPGQRCVVMGEAIEVGERKSLVRTALWSPAGDLLAHAEAVWVALPADR